MHRILYSGFRFSHHNEGSGYHHIADGRHFICGNDLPLGAFPEGSLLRKINYFLTDLLTLFRATGYSEVHYIYPEHTAYLSPLVLKAMGKRVTFTVHLADGYWFSVPRTPFGWMKRLCLRRGAHHIITLSTEQAAAFERRLPGRRVTFVPHGLQLEHPLPGMEIFEQRLRQLSVVMVGCNYRDFDSLEAIIGANPGGVTVHLLGLGDRMKQRFAGMPGVICHGRLKPEQYESLLSTATVMVLPLTFATANNALLEAHKLYLPCLCSRIPGVSDYATTESLFFSQTDEFWGAFSRLASLAPSSYRDLCLRTHAEAVERFSWSKVRRRIAQNAASDE